MAEPGPETEKLPERPLSAVELIELFDDFLDQDDQEFLSEELTENEEADFEMVLGYIYACLMEKCDNPELLLEQRGVFEPL